MIGELYVSRMSSVLNILKPSMSERDGNLYLHCQPISKAPPGDLPEIKQITNKYWSAKITVEINGRIVDMTEWFSISYRKLRLSLDTKLNGACFVMLEELSEDRQNSILEDTEPIFIIDESGSDGDFRWMG